MHILSPADSCFPNIISFRNSMKESNSLDPAHARRCVFKLFAKQIC